jgi:hypothetical protein
MTNGTVTTSARTGYGMIGVWDTVWPAAYTVCQLHRVPYTDYTVYRLRLYRSCEREHLYGPGPTSQKRACTLLDGGARRINVVEQQEILTFQ